MYKNSLCIIGSAGSGKSLFLKELYEETLSILSEKVFVYEKYPIVNLKENATSFNKNEMEKYLKNIQTINIPTIIILDSAFDFDNKLILSAFENSKVFIVLTYQFENESNADVIKKCSKVERLDERLVS